MFRQAFEAIVIFIIFWLLPKKNLRCWAINKSVCNKAKEKTEGQVKSGFKVDDILLGSIIPLNIYK